MLRIEGPLGNFYLREDSPRPIIFVAGGTGFAPIKAIMQHAIAERITTPMHLYWGVRSQRDLYLDALPRSWAERYHHIRYTPVLSEPLPDDAWRGAQGFVTNMVLQDYPALHEFDEPFEIVDPKTIDGYKPAVDGRAFEAILIPNEGLINARQLLSAYDQFMDASASIARIDANPTLALLITSLE